MPHDPTPPRFPPALSPLLIASLERVEDRDREAMAIDADCPERLDEIFESMPALFQPPWPGPACEPTAPPQHQRATTHVTPSGIHG